MPEPMTVVARIPRPRALRSAMAGDEIVTGPVCRAPKHAPGRRSETVVPPRDGGLAAHQGGDT